MLRGEGMRFLVFGLANTVATYLLYCLLVFVMHPQAAYASVFALGIVLAWLGNSLFVFRRPLERRSAARYPLLYLAQYLLSAGLIHLMTGVLGWGPRMALAVTLFITTPLSFAWNRALLGRARP